MKRLSMYLNPKSQWHIQLTVDSCMKDALKFFEYNQFKIIRDKSSTYKGLLSLVKKTAQQETGNVVLYDKPNRCFRIFKCGYYYQDLPVYYLEFSGVDRIQLCRILDAKMDDHNEYNLEITKDIEANFKKFYELFKEEFEL